MERGKEFLHTLCYMKHCSNAFDLFRRFLSEIMENIRIIRDFDTLTVVLKVFSSFISYWSCKLCLFPFSLFYDIGSFERHDFRQLSRVYYFLRALSSRNYKTSVGRSSKFLKRVRLVLFGNDDCTFVIALHLRFRLPPPPPLLSTKFFSQVCHRSSISVLPSFLYNRFLRRPKKFRATHKSE